MMQPVKISQCNTCSTKDRQLLKKLLAIGEARYNAKDDAFSDNQCLTSRSANSISKGAKNSYKESSKDEKRKEKDANYNPKVRDDLVGWFSDGKTCRNSELPRKTKPMPYQKDCFKMKPIFKGPDYVLKDRFKPVVPYVFQHYPDTTQYIEQYRQEHSSTVSLEQTKADYNFKPDLIEIYKLLNLVQRNQLTLQSITPFTDLPMTATAITLTNFQNQEKLKNMPSLSVYRKEMIQKNSISDCNLSHIYKLSYSPVKKDANSLGETGLKSVAVVPEKRRILSARPSPVMVSSVADCSTYAKPADPDVKVNEDSSSENDKKPTVLSYQDWERLSWREKMEMLRQVNKPSNFTSHLARSLISDIEDGAGALSIVGSELWEQRRRRHLVEQTKLKRLPPGTSGPEYQLNGLTWVPSFQVQESVDDSTTIHSEQTGQSKPSSITVGESSQPSAAARQFSPLFLFTPRKSFLNLDLDKREPLTKKSSVKVKILSLNSSSAPQLDQSDQNLYVTSITVNSNGQQLPSSLSSQQPHLFSLPLPVISSKQTALPESSEFVPLAKVCDINSHQTSLKYPSTLSSNKATSILIPPSKLFPPDSSSGIIPVQNVVAGLNLGETPKIPMSSRNLVSLKKHSLGGYSKQPETAELHKDTLESVDIAADLGLGYRAAVLVGTVRSASLEEPSHYSKVTPRGLSENPMMACVMTSLDLNDTISDKSELVSTLDAHIPTDGNFSKSYVRNNSNDKCLLQSTSDGFCAEKVLDASNHTFPPRIYFDSCTKMYQTDVATSRPKYIALNKLKSAGRSKADGDLTSTVPKNELDMLSDERFSSRDGDHLLESVPSAATSTKAAGKPAILNLTPFQKNDVPGAIPSSDRCSDGRHLPSATERIPAPSISTKWVSSPTQFDYSLKAGVVGHAVNCRGNGCSEENDKINICAKEFVTANSGNTSEAVSSLPSLSDDQCAFMVTEGLSYLTAVSVLSQDLLRGLHSSSGNLTDQRSCKPNDRKPALQINGISPSIRNVSQQGQDDAWNPNHNGWCNKGNAVDLGTEPELVQSNLTSTAFPCGGPASDVDNNGGDNDFASQINNGEDSENVSHQKKSSLRHRASNRNISMFSRSFIPQIIPLMPDCPVQTKRNGTAEKAGKCLVPKPEAGDQILRLKPKRNLGNFVDRSLLKKQEREAMRLWRLTRLPMPSHPFLPSRSYTFLLPN